MTRRGIAGITLLIGVVLLIGLRLAAVSPTGRLAYNVVEFKALRLKEQWMSPGPPDFTTVGTISGTVRDEEGQPISGATVLVASRLGKTFWDVSDSAGAYRIEAVPPGRYIPIAARWGHEPALYRSARGDKAAIVVRSGQETQSVGLVMRRRVPVAISTDDSLTLGEPELTTASFPTRVFAVRTPYTFVNEGLLIDGGFLYEPANEPGPFPTLVIHYPGPPLQWDPLSAALAAEGYVVVTAAPVEARGWDMDGFVRDFLKAVAFLRQGQLSASADPTRMAMLAGSFSTLILYRALQEPLDIDAVVVLGGISDAFLGLESIYHGDVVLKPGFDLAIASLGRPDRNPEAYMRYSPAFYPDGLPPMLIIHSAADTTVPPNQSIRLAEALKAAGKPYELYLYEDVEHYLDARNPTPETADMYEKTRAFLARYLGEK